MGDSSKNLVILEFSFKIHYTRAQSRFVAPSLVDTPLTPDHEGPKESNGPLMSRCDSLAHL